MSSFYDKQGQPMTLEEWGRKFADIKYRRIGSTEVGEGWVSTVWLGMDHNMSGEGRPLIFETMIFAPGAEGTERHATEDEARQRHDEIVEALKQQLNI